MYIVMVTIPFGIDDTYYCEYSGIEHSTRKEANKELIKAAYDPQVLRAQIEKR